MNHDLQRLQAGYRALWRHVRDTHGIDVPGSAGTIEAVHVAVHERDGTAWHDAWIPDHDPDDRQEATR